MPKSPVKCKHGTILYGTNCINCARNAEQASMYEGTFEPTAEDSYLNGLAEEYHSQTEAYDRSVCTGRIIGNAIFPATSQEHILINRNARRVLKELQALAYRERGFPHELVAKAIREYRAN